MYTIHETNIKSATDILPTFWRFELKQPFEHKSGCEILLDFDTIKYSCLLMYRNRKGTIIEMSIREQI